MRLLAVRVTSLHTMSLQSITSSCHSCRVIDVVRPYIAARLPKHFDSLRKVAPTVIYALMST